MSRTTITKTGAQLAERRSAYALPLAAEAAEPFPGIPLSDDEIRTERNRVIHRMLVEGMGMYWNEQDKAFVLVQYKKLTRVPKGTNRSGAQQHEDVYRPDRNLAAELKRMTAMSSSERPVTRSSP